MTGRELILKAIHNETTSRPAWLPFVGAHGARLIGRSAEDYLRSAGDAVFRAKGFAAAPGGTVYVDYSAAGFHSEPKDAPATGLECIVSGPRLEEVRTLLADLLEKKG